MLYDDAVTEPSAVLRVSDVSVELGGTAVVRDVSFALEGGELALLTGSNGAGKSTLLRAIVYLLPYRGDVSIAGHDPSSLAARSKFVFVPDEAALYEDLTLREHVSFTHLLYSQPEAEARALSWLKGFNLGDRLDEFPSTHSRGMRQKLALSLALALDTPLIILDEPFNGLDADAQELLVRALRERAEQGGTALLTAHQGELGAALGAKVLELRAGELTERRPAGSR